MPMNRRGFFQTAGGTAGAALVTALGRPEWLHGATTARKASDVLELGPDKVKVTRMAIGLGTNAGNVQRELGLQGVADYLKFAFDQGQFFWTRPTPTRRIPISASPEKHPARKGNDSDQDGCCAARPPTCRWPWTVTGRTGDGLHRHRAAARDGRAQLDDANESR